MIQVTLFISEDDPRLKEIKSRLDEVKDDYPHQLHIINIARDEVLKAEFEEKTPVLDIGVYRLINSFQAHEIRFAFEKNVERIKEARSKGNDVLVQRITEPLKMTKSDRASRWFSNHYMLVMNGFVFLYVFLAIFAPTLMKLGLEVPGRVIYRVYSPLCHQLAYRSFFLYGEQSYNPSQLAGFEGVVTYGQASGFNENDVALPADFLGMM